ncbi:MAG: threonylcarbamoyl-AMP synthase [Thermoplasmata archaeon]|jgi:L-threonylcarbamoyladenylate synthase|nr:threonylcarbamoyl-AMP synthase [Thermoplasmata archaeon]
MASTTPEAARAVARGRLVVYPTDTLLGLAARATDRAAVDRLERLKGRPGGQPLSIALSSTEEIDSWAELSVASRAWARRHLPGPYTLLVRPSPRARRSLPSSIVPAGGRLGVRIPDHPIARELARRAGPITATSANRHGAANARTPTEARRAFGNEVAVYLPSVPPPSGRPSSLVDLSGDQPVLVPRQ